MVNNSNNINKTNNHLSHLKPLNAKKTMTYGIGNPGSILGHAQKSGRIKLVYGIQTSPFDNWISNDNPYI